MQTALQITINGLAMGAVYALIATGFAMIFNILKFSNFSHGALMTISAFIGYYVEKATGWPLYAVIICSMLAGGIIAVFGEFVAFRRIMIRHTSSIYFFVSSITLGTLYEGIATLWAGANFYSYPAFFEKSSFMIGSIVISTADAVMMIVAIVVLIALSYVVQKTKVGRAMRSVSFDRDTANLMGINSTRIIQIAFFISGALAGVSGVFLGMKYTLTTTLGSMVVKGFIASVIGGLGSLSGAVIGAVLLGLLETILTFTVGTGYKEVIILVIMLVFLLARPQGIAGSNVQEKA